MADFVPLSMQQLNSLLQDRQVLSTDVARQGLPQHSQMGQIPGPAIKCVLQVLLLKQKKYHYNIHFYILQPDLLLDLNNVNTFLKLSQLNR